MNRRAIILTGIAIVTALVLFMHWRFGTTPIPEAQQHPNSVAKEEESAEKIQTADVNHPATNIKPATSASAPDIAAAATRTSTLPSPDQPIVDYFDELSERAKNGDKQAGCRLALDMQLCAMQPMFQDGIDSSIEFAAELPPGSSSESRTISNATHFAMLADRAAAVCDGLTPAQISSSWQYMLMAANQGSTTAAVRFAGFPPMLPNINNFAMDAEAWAAYRESAPRLVEFAAQQGDPRALFLLQRLLSGRDTLIGFSDDFFERDPIRAAAYALALMPMADGHTRRGFEQWLEEVQEELSEADMLQAQQMAEQVRGTLSQREPVIDFASGVFNRLEPEDCEEP